jgi:hypothetical protein
MDVATWQEEDDLVNAPILAQALEGSAHGGLPLPDDLVQIPPRATNLVQDHSHVMRNILADVDVD